MCGSVMARRQEVDVTYGVDGGVAEAYENGKEVSYNRYPRRVVQR
jgi:hypothetical protein